NDALADASGVPRARTGARLTASVEGLLSAGGHACDTPPPGDAARGRAAPDRSAGLDRCGAARRGDPHADRWWRSRGRERATRTLAGGVALITRPAGARRNANTKGGEDKWSTHRLSSL